MILPCSCKATKHCLGTLDKLVMRTKGSTVSWKYALLSIHKIFPQFSRGLSAFFYHYCRLRFCLFLELKFLRKNLCQQVNPNVLNRLQKQMFPLITGKKKHTQVLKTHMSMSLCEVIVHVRALRVSYTGFVFYQ